MTVDIPGAGTGANADTGTGTGVPRATLVYIYGPPASGKLTIAGRLSELTGMPLFHNHLTVTALRPVFPFGRMSPGKRTTSSSTSPGCANCSRSSTRRRCIQTT